MREWIIASVITFVVAAGTLGGVLIAAIIRDNRDRS